MYGTSDLRTRKCFFFLYHLSDDELELVQTCEPLQSCRWLMEVCGCVELLLPCPRKCSPYQSFASVKPGCLVVATLSAPPVVVRFRQYMLFRCSRSASVRTRSLFRSWVLWSGIHKVVLRWCVFWSVWSFLAQDLLWP